MTERKFVLLQMGDVIKHKGIHGDRLFVVTGNHGGHVTAVASVNATNPAEWDLLISGGKKHANPDQCSNCRYYQEGKVSSVSGGLTSGFCSCDFRNVKPQDICDEYDKG